MSDSGQIKYCGGIFGVLLLFWALLVVTVASKMRTSSQI